MKSDGKTSKEVLSASEFRQKYLNKKKVKRNKYNASKCVYNGVTYDSTKEANYAFELDQLKKQGKVKDWTPQYKITLKLNGVHICNYFIDFKVEMKDGSFEYHEVKGYETGLWKIKWKLSHALFPDRKFVLIK